MQQQKGLKLTPLKDRTAPHIETSILGFLIPTLLLTVIHIKALIINNRFFKNYNAKVGFFLSII